MKANTQTTFEKVTLVKAINSFLMLILITSFGYTSDKLIAQNLNAKFTYGLYTNSPVLAGNHLILMAYEGDSWSWSGPNSFRSSTKIIEIADVDNSYSGTYYLTIRDSTSNETYYFSTEVEILSPAQTIFKVDFGYDHVCSNTPVNFGAFDITGSNYQWNVYPAGSSITINPNTPYLALDTFPTPLIHKEYTVTLDYIDTSNTVVHAEMVIEVYDCCGRGNQAVRLFYNPHGINLSDIPSNAFLPYIAILGRLNIDAPPNPNTNTSFPPNTVSVSMLQNPDSTYPANESQIYVMNENFVIEPTTQTTFHGCNYMWNGILSNENRPGIYLSNCEIRDAESAVYLQGYGAYNRPKPSKIRVTNTNFVDNWIGMWLWNEAPDIFILSENIFQGTPHQNLLPPLGAPPINWAARGGINLFGCPLIDFVHFHGVPNYFYNLGSGIYVWNSDLYIEPNTTQFQDIPGTTNYTYSGQGLTCAISSEWDGVGNIPQTGLVKYGNTGTWDFNNCFYGVRTKATRSDVESNTMNNIIYDGIRSDFCPWFYAFHNTINIIGNGYGIRIVQCNPVVSLSAAYNTIYTDPNSHAQGGIGVYENILPPHGAYEIDSNVITLNSAIYGIFVQNAQNAGIRKNIIYVNDIYYSMAAIEIENTTGTHVTCNHIQGPGYSQQNQSYDFAPFGIHVVSSSAGVDWNQIWQIYTGMGFEGTCQPFSFRYNHFNYNSFGVWYEGGSLSDPPLRIDENQWYGGTFQYQAFYDYIFSCVPGPTNPWTNLFGLYWCPYPSNCSQWVLDCTYGGVPNDTPTGPCPGSNTWKLDLSLPYAPLGNNDSLTAKNQLGYDYYNEQLTWQAQRILLDKIENDSIISQNLLMQAFQDSVQGASPGKFRDMETQIKSTISEPPIIPSLIDSLIKQIKNKYIQIAFYDSLLFSNPSYSDSVLFRSMRNGYFNNFKQLRVELMCCINSNNAMTYDNVANVLPVNNELPEHRIFEGNEKIINSIFLSTITVGIKDFTLEQRQQIWAVASQCPTSGGKAVFLARSLFTVYGDTAFNDYDICQTATIKKSRMKVSPEEIIFKMFPNPACSYVTLEWNNSCNANAEIQFTNDIGQSVQFQRINLMNKNDEIDVTSLNDGIYYIRILYQNKISNVGKLLIIR